MQVSRMSVNRHCHYPKTSILQSTNAGLSSKVSFSNSQTCFQIDIDNVQGDGVESAIIWHSE